MQFRTLLSYIREDFNKPVTAPKWSGWIACLKGIACFFLPCLLAFLLAHSRLPSMALDGIGSLLTITIIVYLFTRSRHVRPDETPQPLLAIAKAFVSNIITLLAMTWFFFIIPVDLYSHRPLGLLDRFSLVSYPPFVVFYIFLLIQTVRLFIQTRSASKSAA
jgi:hypothetical protein